MAKTYNFKTNNANTVCDLAEMAQDMGIHFSVVTDWNSDITYEIRFHNVSAEGFKPIADFISAERA